MSTMRWVQPAFANFTANYCSQGGMAAARPASTGKAATICSVLRPMGSGPASAATMRLAAGSSIRSTNLRWGGTLRARGGYRR